MKLLDVIAENEKHAVCLVLRATLVKLKTVR